MSRKRKLPLWLVILLSLLLAVLLAVFVLGPGNESRKDVQHIAIPDEQEPVAEEIEKVIAEDQTSIEPQSLQLVPPAERGIALILDDVGYDVPALKRMLRLSVPVAISVIPDAPYAGKSAELAHEAGQVVMLHLPMEPSTQKYRDRMSAAFLHEKMSRDALRQTFLNDLAMVPHVEGVNNHMGSHLTQFEEPMRGVMQLCHERGLFFVDSKTSSKSVAAKIAEEVGISWASRQIFLDHDINEQAMLGAWQRARRCVEKNMRCVVIAHPHAETVNFLEKHLSPDDASNMVSVKRVLAPALTAQRQLKQSEASKEKL
ncbi:divergent polysaccharide deacetylase [Mariprofundus micogutta]|uniref:Divergent polysaccharide deacetylase n=1 Tax=Mariprofundus micogutta TaxID=1921010 RepID=A0A1L8CMG5_9PROT|nr:divergent polysaccharide deacetylase family protein [Mariprofundus micogutta]GAV20096.1 divergent polysaccharide deacetylase [Mariprofundus micogutta]